MSEGVVSQISVRAVEAHDVGKRYAKRQAYESRGSPVLRFAAIDRWGALVDYGLNLDTT